MMIRPILLLFLNIGLAGHAFTQIPTAPSNLQKSRVGSFNKLTWIDNAVNETAYVVERSIGSEFSIVAILEPNINVFQDEIGPEFSTNYRIQAIGVGGQSDYSYEEELPQVLLSCGQGYCYPESCFGTYGSPDYIKSFQTPCDDCQLKITFSRFDTQFGNDDLSIHDGNSVKAPVKGIFSGSSLPPSIVSSGRSLTFFLDNFFSTFGHTGWEFNTQCLQRPKTPGNFTASELTSSQVTLRWSDNSIDEEFFEIQQSKSPFFEENNTETFTTPSNKNFLVLTNLDLTTTYYFRARALSSETQSFFTPTITATTTNIPFEPVPFANNIPASDLRGEMKIGDFNNDKLYDVAIFNLPDEFWILRIYKNLGNGDFELFKEYGTAQINIAQVEWSDMDTDGDLDLVIAEGSAIVLLVNKDTRFDSQIVIPQQGLNYYYPKFNIDDYDKDGDPDIFVYATNHLNASWYINESTSEFTLDAASTIARNFREVVLADINNDTFPDLLTIPNNGGLTIYQHQLNGQYKEISLSGIPSGLGLPLVVDVDNDGDEDLVIKLVRQVGVARNINGAFVFGDWSARAASFVNLAEGMAGDIDNDGDIDLVYGCSTSGNGAAIFINKGDGLFSPITNFNFYGEQPYYYNNVAGLVDYDNDSDVDVVVNYPAYGGSHIWKNNPPVNPLKHLLILGPSNLEIPEDNDLVLTLSSLTVAESPGFPDGYRILIEPNENYEIINTSTVRPHQNFHGNLSIPIRIANATETSDIFFLSVHVISVNDPPQPFNLILPIHNSRVTSSGPIRFEWSESSDIEGQPITYKLLLKSDSVVMSIDNIAHNEVEVDLQNFPDLAGQLVTWSVSAADVESETESNESFLFFYDFLTTEVKDQLGPSGSFYPNPVNNSLHVNNQSGNIKHYSVVDSQGIPIKYDSVSSSQYELIVDVSLLSSGVYLLRLDTIYGVNYFRFVKR